MDTAQLQYLTQQIMIYFGLLIFLLGIIGNIFCVMVFANVRTVFPRSFISSYLLGKAITDLFYILIGLLTKILATGFAIDLTLNSSFFCKLRTFLVYTLPLISTSLACLATIIQFFITSRHQHYRQKITLRFIRSTIFITVIIWTLHNVPYLVLYDIHQSTSSNTSLCNSINLFFNQYTTWININILSFIAPSLILIVFGYLTYRNVVTLKTIPRNNQHAPGYRIQHQLTAIILVQTILLLLSSIPIGMCYLYTVFTASQLKSIERQAIEQLIATIAICVFYANYSGSFYVFFCSSPPFRKQSKKIWRALWLARY